MRPSSSPMESEARYTPLSRECLRPERWHSADEQATELEVRDLIWGLVRALQPDHVIETGTYDGGTSECIGRALEQNGHGMLVTIEKDEALFMNATNRLRPLTCVLPVLMPASRYKPMMSVDFLWFDSAIDARLDEFLAFYPWMHERTVVAFHDTSERHVIVRDQIQELEHRGLLQAVFLPTPRGLALGRVIPGRPL